MTTNLKSLQASDLINALYTTNADVTLIEDDETASEVLDLIANSNEIVDLLNDNDFESAYNAACKLDLQGCIVDHIYELDDCTIALSDDYTQIDDTIPACWDVVGTTVWWLIDTKTGLGVSCYPREGFSLASAIEAELANA